MRTLSKKKMTPLKLGIKNLIKLKIQPLKYGKLGQVYGDLNTKYQNQLVLATLTQVNL